MSLLQNPTRFAERICEGCGKPVLRNLAIYDLDFYHVYCLKRTRARPDYYCTNCFAYWSRGRLGTVFLDEGASKELVCPSCGAIGLVKLKRTTELWMPGAGGCYGRCCIVKNIHSDFHTSIRFGKEDKQYPLVGLRFLFVFLDNMETHKGNQADEDFETDQFIKDQGSISLRYSYSGELSESHAREIVDEIEAKHQEAMTA